MKEKRPDLYLMRQGARYERASSGPSKSYGTMTAIEKELGEFYGDPSITFDPGTWFIHGGNFVRSKRGLEEVAPF